MGLFNWFKSPPQPVHVAGTQRGEELTRKLGREPGRVDDRGRRGYRRSRDSTGVNARHHEPIDPQSVNIPPA